MINLEEARENIGRGVVYLQGTTRMETGVITGVTDRFVFVRYGSNQNSKATNPRHLCFE